MLSVQILGRRASGPGCEEIAERLQVTSVESGPRNGPRPRAQADLPACKLNGQHRSHWPGDARSGGGEEKHTLTVASLLGPLDGLQDPVGAAERGDGR